jgi:hypothetical protein
MGFLSKKDLVRYLAEITVVVLGILIAFQIEEWREERQRQRDQRQALLRLAQETKENLVVCTGEMRFFSDLTGIKMVVNALQAGVLADEDKELFHDGLATASALPNLTILTTVADEMISTGILKELEDIELRSLIARLQSSVNLRDRNYSNRRESVRDVGKELANHIDILYQPSSPGDAKEPIGWRSEEQNIQVIYNFAELAASRRLKNLFFEALDARADHWRGYQRNCELIAAIDEQLAEQGIQ